MCLGPDPNARIKAQSEERDRQRRFEFAGKNLAYTNRSRIVAAAQKDVAGLIKSRNLSDLKVGLEQQKGRYLKNMEAYTASILKNRVTGVAKGGGSISRQAMLRGGSKADQYLQKIQRVEAGYESARTRGMDILLEQQRRNQMASNESLRKQQGLPPNFGRATHYVPVQDNRAMNTIATGLSIAAMFATGGASTALTAGAAVAGSSYSG